MMPQLTSRHQHIMSSVDTSSGMDETGAYNFDEIKKALGTPSYSNTTPTIKASKDETPLKYYQCILEEFITFIRQKQACMEYMQVTDNGGRETTV